MCGFLNVNSQNTTPEPCDDSSDPQNTNQEPCDEDSEDDVPLSTLQADLSQKPITVKPKKNVPAQEKGYSESKQLR